MDLRYFNLKKLLSLLLLFICFTAYADVFVNGYYRSNGTYVQPHFRSSPDASTFNNWNSWGNINPYTGKYGTSNPYTAEAYKFYRKLKPKKLYKFNPYKNLPKPLSIKPIKIYPNSINNNLVPIYKIYP